MLNLDLYLPPVIEHLYPPCAISRGNQTYVILGTTWVAVPAEHWEPILHEARRRYRNPYAVVMDPPQTWEVQGSTGKYIVTKEQGTYHCTCQGYEFKRNCTHIQEVKGEIAPRKYHVWTSDSGLTKYALVEAQGKLTCPCATFKKNGTCKHSKEMSKTLGLC